MNARCFDIQNTEVVIAEALRIGTRGELCGAPFTTRFITGFPFKVIGTPVLFLYSEPEKNLHGVIKHL